ncbi:MAG: SUMF1/EgtB/PvdO family nonheme iron enzyme [bacterium]
MAPELHTEGSEPDARADVYSLSVIIGEMAFGPDYTPGTNVAAGLKGLDALCRRATAFSRDERYPSIEALLEDLTTLVDTGSLVEPFTPPTPPKPPVPPPSTGAKVLAPPPAPVAPPPAASVNMVDDAQIEEEIATVEYSRVDEPEIQDLLTTNEVSRTPLKRPTPPKGSSARIHTQTVQSGPPTAPEPDNTKWWAIAGVAFLVGVVVLWKINQSSPSGDDVVQLGSKVTTTPASTQTAAQNQQNSPAAETIANNAASTATQTTQTSVETAAQTAEQPVQTNQAAVTAAQTATQTAAQPVVAEKTPPVENTVVAAVTPPVVKDTPPVEVETPKPAASGTQCPSGSVLVKSKSGNYCVDVYEFPGSGAPPKTRVNWFEAKKLCAASGKRLCTLTEWKGACGSKYPYGSTFNADSCNTADEDGFERSLAKAGASKSCRSRSGTYDMSGNVHEWVEEKRIAGGSYESDEDVASCRYSSAKAPGSSAADIGFRCCADPE